MDKLKFGFDIDGCIANIIPLLCSTVIKECSVKFTPRNISRYSIEEILDIPRSKVIGIINEVIANVDEVKPYPGAITFIQKYYEYSQEPIVLVSNRWDYYSTQVWLNKWLSVPWIIKYTDCKKGQIVKDLGIDVFVEDRIENAEDIAKAGATVLLISRMWNKFYRIKDEGIIRVKGWKGITEFFEKERSNVNMF